MSEEMKACPFCGGKAEIKQTGKNRLTIECTRCRIKKDARWLYLSREWLEKELIQKWNTRPEEPRCDKCRYWDQYQSYNIETHKIEGVMDLGGCYQHIPVKTTEIGISTKPDFYCKHFERKDG